MSDIKRSQKICCVCGVQKVCNCATLVLIPQNGKAPRPAVTLIPAEKSKSQIAQSAACGQEYYICDDCAEKEGKAPTRLLVTYFASIAALIIGMAITFTAGALNPVGLILATAGGWVMLFSVLFLIMKAGLGLKGFLLALVSIFFFPFGVIAVLLLREDIVHNEKIVTALTGWAAKGIKQESSRQAEKTAGMETFREQKSPADYFPLVDKLAHFQTFSFDRTEEEAMGRELLSGGDAALEAIVSYLTGCAYGRQTEYWWNDAAYLVRLIKEFPDADYVGIYRRLMAPQTNIWEYQTQIKDVAQQEMLNLKKSVPGYDPTKISPEDAQAELKELYQQGGSPSDRIRRAIGMQPCVESWTDADKAFYYYIIGDALKRRDPNDARRYPFYAAQVFYQPQGTSLGWYELIQSGDFEGLSPSPENARMLHEQYPLPENWDGLL